MKIECTKDQKERIVDVIADCLDCDRIIAGEAAPELCKKYTDCKDCVRNEIKWKIVDSNDEDDTVTNSIYMFDKKDATPTEEMKIRIAELKPLTFNELKSHTGEQLLAYDKASGIWGITSIDSVAVVFTSATDKKLLVKETFRSGVDYTKQLWYALPDIHKEGE